VNVLLDVLILFLDVLLGQRDCARIVQKVTFTLCAKDWNILELTIYIVSDLFELNESKVGQVVSLLYFCVGGCYHWH